MARAESSGSMSRDEILAVSMSAQDTRKLEMAADMSEMVRLHVHVYSDYMTTMRDLQSALTVHIHKLPVQK